MSIGVYGHNGLDFAAMARLDDVALMAGLHRLVQQDRALTARLLLHLGEVEARGLYREQAFPSMFEYAVEALHIHVQEVLRCRCGEHIVTAPGAPKVVEQGRYGAGLLAHLVVAKCVDSIPDALSEARGSEP